MNDFADLRRTEFGALEGGGVYLNSASIGPVPSRALAVLAACNRDRGRPGMWPIERINAILTEARWLAGRLVNATEHEIALMPNTTTGLNIAARALPLGAGDIVVTFDGEFPANVYPWLRLADKGVTLERIPRTAEGWPDELAMHRRIEDPRVKAITVSLTQFSNGYTVDLAQLSALTRAANKWLVVDAIQGAGHVPIDVQKTPVDFLAAGAQKWLLSPWGTGFLYVRKELCTALEPTFAGWAAYAASADYTSLTSYDQRFWPDARRFELLSHAIQDFAAFNASLGLILGLGVERIATHARALHGPVIAWARANGASITSPTGERGSAILCVKPAGDVAGIYARLQSAGVQCSLREGAIRLSPHLFNDLTDMQHVVELLDKR